MTLFKKVLPFFLFGGVALLYIHNLSRSVYGGDVGDLVTAAYVFGVPHPPGYPLFSLLGFILTRFIDVLSQTPAFMVGLISVFSSAGAVVLFYLISKRLTKNELVSFIGALILAFSYLFWFYAEIAEVFALNNFFAFLLLYVTLLYRENKKVRTLYLLSFIVGLSLTNHHTIIFLFPTFLLLSWQNVRVLITKNKKAFLWCFIAGLLGFSVYLYAFIASLMHPIIDWANIKGIADVQGLLDLILRKRYGTFEAGSFPTPPPLVRFVILKNYALTLLSQLTIPVIVISSIGIISLLRRTKVVGIALVTGFILSGPFFIGYAGFPLSDSYRFGVYERFLSLSAMWLVLFFPLGLLSFTSFLGKFFTKKIFVLFFQIIFLILPLQLFLFNFPKTNLSTVSVGDDFGYDELKSLPKNSVLLLSSDTNLFNTWYVRYALGFREDVTVLNALAPDVTNLQLSYLDNRVKTNDRDVTESVTSLHYNVEFLDPQRPVFTDLKMRGPKGDFVWQPLGLNYSFINKKEVKLTQDEYIKQSEMVWDSFTVPTIEKTNKAERSLTITDIPLYYANAAIATANYLVEEYNATDSAELYFKKAVEFDKTYAKSTAALGTFYFTQRQDCQLALTYLTETVKLDPTEKRFYYLLYISQNNCDASENEKKTLLKQFQEVFNTSLQEDLKKNFSEEEIEQ